MLCRQCGEDKDKSCFNRDKGRSHGVRSVCKYCRTFNAENARLLSIDNNEKRICFGCKLILSLDSFHKDNRRSDGFALRCKSCYSEKNRKMYGEQRATRLEYAKDYYNKKLDNEGESYREEIRVKSRKLWAELKFL